MEQIFDLLIRILFVFLIIVALHGIALGDIAPPPPEIPGTQIELPPAPAIAVAGILLAIATATAGRISAKNHNKSRNTITNVAATGIVAATIAATAMASWKYQGYENMRQQWRPNGPVEQIGPIDQFTPPESP